MKQENEQHNEQHTEQHNEQHTEKQARKPRAKNGESAQKMIAFRLDGSLIGWLEKMKNKGRYINDLIHRDKTRWYKEHAEDDDLPPYPRTADGYQQETIHDYES